MMRQFAAFIKKEFLHVLRDARTMLILLGMPVVQIILFGFAISTEIRNIDLAVVIPSADGITRKLTEKMDASEYFTVRCVLQDSKDIERYFRDGTVSMAIAFSPDFADEVFSPEGSAIQLITDGSNTNTARTAAGYASAIILDGLTGDMPVSTGGIRPNIRMLFNPQLRSSYTFVPGVMGLIIILICAMMTSISIVREKETGTMGLMLVSPMRPSVIILSKMVPYMVLSTVNYLTILLLSVTLLDVPLSGNFWSLSLLSLIYIIVSLALGLLISTKARTQLAAMLGSGMLLMIPVVFLSGLMFPVESMPGFFRAVSAIVPARWYIEGVKKLMIEGLPIWLVTKEFIILSAMAVLLLAVSIRNFKLRLK